MTICIHVILFLRKNKTKYNQIGLAFNIAADEHLKSVFILTFFKKNVTTKHKNYTRMFIILYISKVFKIK